MHSEVGGRGAPKIHRAAISRLSGYRLLSTPYERKPRNYLPLLGLAAILCCYKRLALLTTLKAVLRPLEDAAPQTMFPGRILTENGGRSIRKGRGKQFFPRSRT
ncbi:hypothetical protein GCM10010211_01130 [Streptomyces albospinus]|uniref:Transposase n=1 Tax=Streptomyces albospinus TaxID=285515 RepID=A0ABQ2UKQ2_9ACTN|nr:hypothetical protein GCM10010211_01130 [Streptomyces albospinus]